MLNTIDLIGTILEIGRTDIVDETCVIDCTISIEIGQPNRPKHPDTSAIIEARTWGCDAVQIPGIAQGQEIRVTIQEIWAELCEPNQPPICMLTAEISNVWPASSN
jgi:hypothetical protein